MAEDDLQENQAELMIYFTTYAYLWEPFLLLLRSAKQWQACRHEEGHQKKEKTEKTLGLTIMHVYGLWSKDVLLVP